MPYQSYRRFKIIGKPKLLPYLLIICAILILPLASPIAHAQHHEQFQCNSTTVFSMPKNHSSSNWQLLTNNSNDITAIQVSGADEGYQLNLTSAWSPDDVFFSEALRQGSQTFHVTPATDKPIIGFVTNPAGSTGIQVSVKLCTGSVDVPEIPTDPAEPDNPGDEEVNDTDNGSIVTAQESGLTISTAFDIAAHHYWANHEGVRNTLSDACIRLHDSYWTQGPDEKVYPTWHPPVSEHPNGEICYFGHEHGDDPSPSAFYSDAQYQQLRDDKFIPIPFGYANEVYAAAQGMRHEDHFGHKIFRENFETAYGNSVSTASVQGTGSICTALLKLHQGTHSADALTNHLHEVIAHIDCSALPGYERSRVHTTALVPLGRPGWFSNNCGPYQVPQQTSGTRGTGENNAFAGNLTGNPPVALGGRDQSGNGGSSIKNLNALTDYDVNHRIDGERIIPAAACVHTYQSATSTKANNYKFGHAMNDTWVRPLMITNASGDNPRMMIKSYYSVFNPARTFFVEPNNQVGIRPTVDMCRNPPASAGGPTTPSLLCQSVLNNPNISQFSIDSPYNGTIRNVNFKSLHISNFTGTTEIWTDAFGRESNSRDPINAIKQFVSNGYNGVAGAGADGTIARPNSVQVCRKSSGPYPMNLPVSDPCYWNGNDDLLFSKEWWRNYSNPADRIHSPN